jgi:hypothetical protein
MTIQDIFAYLAFVRSTQAAYPYAHYSKKGPGRKHQQTFTLTKRQREAANV